ncbi:hypothetical protein [Hymenobacter guriensis]|uniref:Uncharacterized protein n=1 Tax=Hymenobacter guriensis TaxID=2793065 RepID=A0ABS0L1S9_9BACT|nr:hypothetical protein [Hymenobacter guriensis]MBG8553337.1 hypothetical protein [Hymenobacter guriensis]
MFTFRAECFSSFIERINEQKSRKVAKAGFHTVLNAAGVYKLDNAKSKAGQNIYRAVREANFTIGFLLSK